VHFRRGSDVRETPQATFDEWNARFHFTLDVCALPENAECARYFTPEQDGLQQDWGREICWMNPPYGRAILQWIRKAYEASKAGATVVCLVPSKTGPRWWQEYVIPYVAREDIHSLPGRLKFGGAAHNAPFDSAVVIFRPNVDGGERTRAEMIRSRAQDACNTAVVCGVDDVCNIHVSGGVHDVDEGAVEATARLEYHLRHVVREKEI